MSQRILPAHDVIEAYRHITIDDVLAMIPTTRQTLYRWMDADTFPKPIKLGKSMIGFRETEVVAWLNARPRALGGEAEYKPQGRKRRARASGR